MKCIFRDSDGRCCKTVCQFHLILVSEKTCNECDEKQTAIIRSSAAEMKILVNRALQYLEKPIAEIIPNSPTQRSIVISKNDHNMGIALLKEALEIK